jgi:hypothetical protein
MPLIHGYSKNAFAKNLRMLREEGKPRPQAMAICFSVARKALKDRGLKETATRRREWQQAIKIGMQSFARTSKARYQVETVTGEKWHDRGRWHNHEVRLKSFKTKKEALAYARKRRAAGDIQVSIRPV